MKENKNIHKYNIWFNSLVAVADWDLTALKWAYKRGLANRIKDEMTRVEEPVTLAAYRQEVLRIDNRYWRREEEKKREVVRNPTRNPPNPRQNPSGSSNPSNPNPPSRQNRNTRGNQQRGNTPPRNNPTTPSTTDTRPYANKLGADGKLNQAERERRKKYNLCPFCGGKHKFEDCDKRKPSTRTDTRARATKTQSESAESKPSEIIPNPVTLGITEVLGK